MEQWHRFHGTSNEISKIEVYLYILFGYLIGYCNRSYGVPVIVIDVYLIIMYNLVRFGTQQKLLVDLIYNFEKIFFTVCF